MRKLRNQLFFMIPSGYNTVYISTAPLSGPHGIPVMGDQGCQIRGKACELPYYCWSVDANVPLTILAG